MDNETVAFIQNLLGTVVIFVMTAAAVVCGKV